jgi:hypothetical protein
MALCNTGDGGPAMWNTRGGERPYMTQEMRRDDEKRPGVTVVCEIEYPTRESGARGSR